MVDLYNSKSKYLQQLSVFSTKYLGTQTDRDKSFKCKQSINIHIVSVFFHSDI